MNLETMLRSCMNPAHLGISLIHLIGVYYHSIALSTDIAKAL